MPYDDDNFIINDDVYGYDILLDTPSSMSGISFDITGESETESDVVSDPELLLRSDGNDSFVDYSDYLESIITNQEIIILNQETIISLDTEIQNNGYRLYYFVGGLYVAFAIVIMIKFFKTFLF